MRERKERERARAHLDRSLALLAPFFPCLGSKTVFSSSFLARLGWTFVRVVAIFSSSCRSKTFRSRLLGEFFKSSLSLRTFTNTHPRLAGLAPRYSFLASLSFVRSPLSRASRQHTSSPQSRHNRSLPLQRVSTQSTLLASLIRQSSTNATATQVSWMYSTRTLDRLYLSAQ